MSKRFIKITVALAILFTFGIGIVVWQNNIAFAKNKAGNNNPTNLMAKYSVKSKKNHSAAIRRGRINQLNFVTEAAQVLNVLPITIMQEMVKGKDILQIAQDKGFTKDDFVQKLTDLENKTINESENSGSISKEHSKALRDGLADRVKNNLTLKAVSVKEHNSMNMNN